ncbi:MAG: hypothetical protein HKM06_08170, partial [Spirochaetales bacterium]|nr:hypothetical protein [Spirochaetales bacterium]
QGLPVWQPLALVYTHETLPASAADEFMVGDNLLVAPLGPVSASGTTRKVYLPGNASWFDVRTDEELAGGREYDVSEGNEVPVFARAGAMVPTQDPLTYDGKDVFWATTVQIWPGAPGEVELSWDDGVSQNAQGGERTLTQAAYLFSDRTMELDLTSLQAWAPVTPGFVLYRLHNVYRPQQVSIDNAPIPLFGDSWGVTDTDRSASWYEHNNTLLIKVFRPDKTQTVQMVF